MEHKGQWQSLGISHCRIPRADPERKTMNRLATALTALALAAPAARADETPLPDGNAVIRAPAGNSEIVITTTSRVAGAVDSLTWGGREFIDSYDHGRQLQSAANFDAGSPITAETFNPTEAGSRRDGTGATSTSRLLHMVVTSSALQTTTQMAFWLAPGEKSGPNAAKNKTALSNHLLTKRIGIGYRDMPHVITYDVTFSVPVGQRHRKAVFEAVTGYMPPDFERFHKFQPDRGTLEPLSNGPGEQPMPVVFSTADGRHAMGCIAPRQSRPGYGRFRFRAEKVVKWNCVFRSIGDREIAPGDYHFKTFIVVGDLQTVTKSLIRLHGSARER